MNHDEKEAGFISHLAELRKRLKLGIIFLIIFFIAIFFFSEKIYGLLLHVLY